MSEIFVLTPHQELVPLSAEPYSTEDLLQTLLANYPNLLAGEQIRPDAPRRWMLVKREAAVPREENGSGHWSLDHLFLDQDGVPTLVEVKRSTDTRIRREVVGQMLDYAANGVKYWPIEALQAAFEATCASAGVEPSQRIQELLGSTADEEEFWKKVKTNLQAGRIRMLFVADEIPDELRRVVEFLNEQMDPAEVLAVEIKQFVGGGLKTLVPRVIGQTIEAEDRKRASTPRQKRKWDEQQFFAALVERGNRDAAHAAKTLLDWAKAKATYVWWGEGQVDGSFIPVFVVHGSKIFPFAVYTSRPGGTPYLLLYFEKYAKRPPFDSGDRRMELLRRFNAIPGVQLDPEVINRWASIPLAALANRDAAAAFTATIEWLVAEAQRASIAE